MASIPVDTTSECTEYCSKPASVGLDYTVLDEDVANWLFIPDSLSVYNRLGRYSFAVLDAVAKGEFRTFRKNSDSRRAQRIYSAIEIYDLSFVTS